MSEVRTSPVAARHIPEKSEFQRDFGAGRVPGSFRVDPPDSDGEQTFWYVCPCGCGSLGPLTVGNGFKPSDGPSWHWNGLLDKPTLSPSVHHVGHWHGWLRNGVWESC